MKLKLIQGGTPKTTIENITSEVRAVDFAVEEDILPVGSIALLPNGTTRTRWQALTQSEATSIGLPTYNTFYWAKRING